MHEELWTEFINCKFSLEIRNIFYEYISVMRIPGIDYKTIGACKLIYV